MDEYKLTFYQQVIGEAMRWHCGSGHVFNRFRLRATENATEREREVLRISQTPPHTAPNHRQIKNPLQANLFGHQKADAPHLTPTPATPNPPPSPPPKPRTTHKHTHTQADTETDSWQAGRHVSHALDAHQYTTIICEDIYGNADAYTTLSMPPRI